MKESEIILYTTPNGEVKIDIRFEDETFWLTQKKIADLFEVDRTSISRHLSNIFEDGELNKDVVCAKYAHTTKHGAIKGKTQKTETTYYNLDAIIAVGYRVNSFSATQFRIWATKTLKEFIIKGFVMDDERLKQGQSFGKDYFEELLERIRSIRASERRFYQKITDIYKEASIDYDAQSPITREFYQTVQNKMHGAITGQTAAEIIKHRVDSEKTNMGITTWKNAPKGKILKSDVAIAKNYLKESEVKSLERIVTMYLDFAELQAERQIQMKMSDWVLKLDAFLQFNDYEVLQNAGNVSAAVAKRLAEEEYSKFAPIQDRNYVSDFDLEIKKLKQNVKSKVK